MTIFLQLHLRYNVLVIRPLHVCSSLIHYMHLNGKWKIPSPGFACVVVKDLLTQGCCLTGAQAPGAPQL